MGGFVGAVDLNDFGDLGYGDVGDLGDGDVGDGVYAPMTSTVPGSQSWLLVGITTRYSYITNDNDESRWMMMVYVSALAWHDNCFALGDVFFTFNNPKNVYATKAKDI